MEPTRSSPILKLSFFCAALAAAASPIQSKASSMGLHYAEDYLTSIYRHAFVTAPRLQIAALHTNLAHPSFLERKGLINETAVASYNDWTNTLTVHPSLTIFDPAIGRERLRNLREIHESTGALAANAAATLFHELSHAEWDFDVEEGSQDFDRTLTDAIKKELPAIEQGSNLSFLARRKIASEIFAYYRQELLMTILTDSLEIKMMNGLDPDTLACRPVRTEPDRLRNLQPLTAPYSERVKLLTVFVQGVDVQLGADPKAAQRLNQALYEHSEKTLDFPKDRIELRNRLAKDPEIKAAFSKCFPRVDP